jgi:hypothetical protein
MSDTSQLLRDIHRRMTLADKSHAELVDIALGALAEVDRLRDVSEQLRSLLCDTVDSS